MSLEETQTADKTDWALKLFSRSPLKQRKFNEIVRCLPELADFTCLDLGSDNGVISFLLREQGGLWYSADLNQETVTAIRSLVGERVDLIDPKNLSYPNNHFDLVVVVDLLEHVPDDRQLIRELARVLKKGGRLIINVPNPKEGWLRWFRFRLGQTDQAHGHLRAGYDLRQLQTLVDGLFVIENSRGYGGVFSELVDTVITFGLDLLKRNKRSEKGSVTTEADMSRHAKSFKLFSLLYPLLKLCVGLDRLIPFSHKNMLIAVATRI